MFARSALFQIALLLGAMASAALAQDKPPSLIASYLEIAPFGQLDPQGNRSGFLTDLATELASEIDAELQFVEPATSREFVEHQVNGVTQIIAGVARLPALEATNVFSNPIATETLRLVVLSRNAATISANPLTGLRIGIVPPAAGSEIRTLLAENEPVSFESPEAALFNLLKGRIDAVLAPGPVIFSQMRQAGVDDLVSFVEPPIRTFQRFVALHQSRADLLDPINDAIARMEQDGSLQRLRDQYFVDTPQAPPAVLTVGVTEFPPYNIHNPDGTFSGFGVESIEYLARLTGLQLEFKPITQAEFMEGPSPSTFDMLPQTGVNERRREIMDFTLPLEHFEFAIYVRKDEADGVSDLDSLGTRLVGVQSGNLAERFAEEHGGLTLKVFEDSKGLARALGNGEIGAALYPMNAMRDELRRQDLANSITEITPPFHVVDRAPALRPGLGQIRERLNDVIPGFLISQDYANLRAKYFGQPNFWTETRVYATLGIAMSLILALTGFLIWQQQRQRALAFNIQKRELARQRLYNDQLDALVTKLELANREQAEFTYAISHDLKSPANTIGMLIKELSRQSELSPTVQEILSDMSLTNERMGRLIEDVLTYSGLVEQTAEDGDVDLNTVIENVRADLAADINAAEAKLQADLLPSVKGHQTQIQILFQNLIANAVKFREAGRQPRIQITSRQTARSIEIVVADNGIGIPPEHHDRIFGLFQRLHITSSYDGTGLGLAICKRIMTVHDGEISVGPGLGGGTAFTLSFPKAGVQRHG